MSALNPPRLRPARQVPWKGLLLGALLLVLLLPFVLFAAWRSGLSREIDVFEQRARDAGEPITLAELAVTRAPIPDDENALVALMALWADEDPEFWRAFQPGATNLPQAASISFDPQLPVLGRDHRKTANRLPWTEPEIAAARAFVATQETRAARVKLALTRPRAQFPLEVIRGLDTPLPHLARLKHEAGRLLVAALLASHDGRTGKALDLIHQTFQAADLLRDEPFMISQLVRTALLGIALNAAEEWLAHTTPDPAELNRLSALLGKLDLSRACYQALLGERAMSLDVFTRPLDELGTRDAEQEADPDLQDAVRGLTMQNSPLNAVGFFSLDRLLMLQTFDRAMELTRDGDWTEIVKVQGVIHEAQVKSRKFPPRIMTGMLLPALGNAGNKFVSVEARRRGALLALEVERHRRSHGGQLPDSLEALPTPPDQEWLTDPYTGQRIRYLRRDDGFVIYSLGPDQQDQQGATVAPRGQPAAFDVAFKVTRTADDTGEP